MAFYVIQIDDKCILRNLQYKILFYRKNENECCCFHIAKVLYPRASITLLALSDGAVAAKIFDQKSARRSDPVIELISFIQDSNRIRYNIIFSFTLQVKTGELELMQEENVIKRLILNCYYG